MEDTTASRDLNQIDISEADYIKRMGELYGVGDGVQFEQMFNRVHHPDDPEKFDELMAELRRKKLL